jgi:GNAT superfamily N-acetyltransferase
MQARLVPVSVNEREALETAFRDFERHFADLLQLPGGQPPRGLDGDPFTTPGREIYWLEWQGQHYGFVLLDRVEVSPAGLQGKAGSARLGAIQITRHSVFPEYRSRGLGSLGLPLLEAYAVASGRPLTWSCWLINPALRFWERWGQELAGKGWHVATRPRDTASAARTYTAWPPG